MKIVLEITQKEKDAIKHASREVKNVFSKLRNSFEIKVVKNRRKK